MLHKYQIIEVHYLGVSSTTVANGNYEWLAFPADIGRKPASPARGTLTRQSDASRVWRKSIPDEKGPNGFV